MNGIVTLTLWQVIFEEWKGYFGQDRDDVFARPFERNEKPRRSLPGATNEDENSFLYPPFYKYESKVSSF